MTLDPRRPVRIGGLLSATPIVVIDFETTGVDAGSRAVEVGFARFEGGELAARYGTRVNPGIPISAEATAVHHITDADVADAPTIEHVFGTALVRQLLQGAQPLAYNAPFDQRHVPWPVVSDLLSHEWPWLDALVAIREVDRFVKGRGRHRLEVSCTRYGITLDDAHSALADATAAGQLFIALTKFVPKLGATVGEALVWTSVRRAEQWHGLETYFARQAPQVQP